MATYVNPDHQFETDYGYFNQEGTEYIIKTPRTPKPWINVLSNGRYGLTISQSGGGFSWLDHSELNRITRWHQDLVKDDWGKYLYIRDNDSGEVWSPTWLPVRTELDEYQCRHGFGYTVFQSRVGEIRITLTLFIPMNEQLEIWDVEIENLGSESRSLSLFNYFEWTLGSSNDHHREFHKNFIQTRFDPETNTIWANKRLWDIALGDRGHWNIEHPFTAFLSSTRKTTGFECDKEAFLGQYGSMKNPEAVTNNGSPGKQGLWHDAIASLKILVELAPGGKENLAYLVGMYDTPLICQAAIDKFQSQAQRFAALSEVKAYWSHMLGAHQMETPDASINILANGWLKYQAISARIYGRSAYYQQSGAYGFRDQLQDSQVFLPIDVSKTEKQIKLHAAHQYLDGTVLHWWHPITEQGLHSGIADNYLWLPFLVISYLQETDNIAFLQEQVPFYDDKQTESIYEHCLKSIKRSLQRTSQRGLPFIGAGDWNDGMSAVGLEEQGESVWLAHFLYYILKEFIILADEMDDNTHQKLFQDKALTLNHAIQTHGWDGDWFIRATGDDGDIIGGKDCKEGKIYLNTQTWSVISGSGTDEQRKKSMAAVTKHLLKDFGPLLLAPAYSDPDPRIGYLSRYAAGTRENGGVYTHAATWAIWAYALQGQPELAFKVYQGISPIHNGMNPERYLGEPYVTPGNIDGPDSAYHGRGGWTWYTGSASWLYKMVSERILGIQPSRKGLVIDPAIPAEWKHYSMTRKFGETVYTINVSNPNNHSTGISKLQVDGLTINGNVIPPQHTKTCLVQVTM
ncbi:glycosyl transferase family 36 [bacterium]|nr:glycosyl transferase family 36 [bacterium]